MAQLKYLAGRSVDEIRTNGIRSFTNQMKKFLYYHIYLKYRDKLPPNLSKEQVRNGVRVRNEDAKLLDTIIGFPFHENNEIELIKEYVESGDTVIDIGGGIGVATTWCARKAGREGKVYVYESSSTSIGQLESTLDLNPIDATVDVNHAIVGEIGGQVRFDEGEKAEIVSSKDLPECDVLNMDCEGAELSILQNMTICPRVILVETHAKFDASGKKIIDILEKMEYDIVEIHGDIDGIAQIAATRTNSDG